MENKFGLLTRDKNVRDWVAGSFTPLDLSLVNPEGDWSSYLPVDEFQNRRGYDRMACATYSILNCIEILYRFNTGHEKNFSDRELAKKSGTTKSGNYLDNVFDWARKTGLIEEYLYPDDANSWDEYYKELKPEFSTEAKKFLDEWSLYREWVRADKPEDIFLALKSAPLQATVCYAGGSGILKPDGTWNHAITVYNAEHGVCWHIFDHYTQTRKRYAWDYEFGAVLKPSLVKRNNDIIMNIQNNTLLQLVQGNGSFGLYLDGKIIVDEADKILATYIVRNQGDIKGKTKALTLEQWNSLPHVDLKGNKV